MNYEDIVNKFSVVDSIGNTPMTAFVVDKKRRVLYFHIAKTGGSTITHVLRKNGYDDGVLTSRKVEYSKKLEYFTDVAKHWNEYKKFTFIRNKYSQLVSLFHYDGEPGKTFDVFIKDIVNNSPDIYGWWIDQYHLTIIDRKKIFDWVGEFESFGFWLENSLRYIGIKKHKKRLVKNKGNYDRKKALSEYYDDELKTVVDKKFSKEMELFGWKIS